MNYTAELFTAFLKKIIHDPFSAYLDTAEVPGAFMEFANELIALKVALKHITWQAKQIAEGDYSHHANFIDEFSAAFNTITHQLSEGKQKLEDDMDQIEAKTNSLEQYSMLISSLIQYIPQQILVIDKESFGILLMNELAILEVYKDSDYVENIVHLLDDYEITPAGTEADVTYAVEGEEDRHLHVRAFSMNWDDKSALIFAISDVSETKNEIRELQIYAFHDSLTNLYNRTFGMRTLEAWINEKRQFVLLFADLDRLKYINDAFGHNEGDMYIINAAKHLMEFPKGSVVCRLGGDEFMVLIPNTTHAEVEKKSAEIYTALENDPYQADKEYSYSMSFGFVVVDEDNELPSRVILHTADELMYENKKARKAARL